MRRTSPRARSVLGLLAAFTATSVVGGVVLAGLLMPAVGASGLAASQSVEFFDSLPGELAQPPLAEQSVLLASDGTVIARFFEENRVNVPLDKIAPAMQKAVVAIEDSRFYEHGGVDPQGLARAYVVNKLSGKIEQGASTLTQQYVKNVLIETAAARGDEAGIEAAREQTNARKLREIRYAVSLEKKLDKDEILNRYLNIAWFGGKLYGVQAAAKHYFGTTAAALTLPQAALLAGLIQSPVEWSPTNNPEAALERRNVVLKRMLELGMIDQAAHDAGRAVDLGVKITRTRPGCANAGYNGFICDYVYRLIRQSDAFSALGKTPDERENTLLRGGLVIRTSMSPKIQKAAWAAASSTIPPADPSGVAAAVVTVEPGTGRVLAMAQNRLFDPGGGPGKTATNFSTDYSLGGSQGFQTGSTFKPFTLATWLRKGKSLNAVVSAAPGPAPFSDFKSCGSRLRGPSYSYSNSEGGGSAPMPVIEATYKSVNTAYVAMEKQLDLCDIKETAQSLGVHLAYAQPDECAPESERKPTTELPDCVPSLTLGPKEIAPLTMAAAYASFAAAGKYCSPVIVESIADRDGNAIAVPRSSCKQAISKDVANGVTFALKNVFTRGTAARIGGLDRPAAGKTGTTNNSVDTWFVGYTAQLSTAVWVGDPVPKQNSRGQVVRRSLNGVRIDGERRGRVYGATFAAPIWKKMMKTSVKGMPKKGFSDPPAKLLKGEGVRVPGVLGRSPNDAVGALQAAGFRPRVEGGFVDSRYPAGTVGEISPGPGTLAPRGTEVTIRLSSGRGGGGGNQGPGTAFDDLRDLLNGNNG